MKTKHTPLIIGQQYWILDGQLRPFICTLTELVNEGRTALFGGLPRKVTSVYQSKEEAEQKRIY